MNGRAFVPSRDTRFYLLQAHRQPLAANVAAHWIETVTAPGDVVIDPFVASDAIVRAALERGRKIIAADANPLVAWAARMEAALPAAREINAALLRLGDTRKEGESLRAFVEKMYASTCSHCGEAVIVDYFIQRREGDKTLLAEKVFHCKNCGLRREDATEADRQRAADAKPHGLSYQLLVQRLIADDPAHSALVKQVLGFYTPRNLAALAALSQKLDAEFREDAARNVLAALLLHALDVGTSLYLAVNGVPFREIPAEFIEFNIWRALENAASGLTEHAPSLRLTPNVAGVLRATMPAAFIGAGGARFLSENAKGANAALILSSPARLDPSFWELSFVWTRWLFNKTAAAPLEPLLDEQRQRWGSYGEWLSGEVDELAKLARNDAHFVVAFPSGSHAMIEALMLAASPVFALDDFAFRPERGATRSTEFGAVRGDYQVVWHRHTTATAPNAPRQVAPKIRAGALRAAIEILEARNEPLLYSWLHHAALDQLARDGILAETMTAKYREGDNAFQFLRHRLDEGFKEGYIHDLDHWEEKDRVLWLAREREDRKGQLAEQVADAVRELLRENGRVRADELEDKILQKFSGLLTPEPELVNISARAVADWIDGEWVWRGEDVQAQFTHARRLVRELGERLGYKVVEQAEPIQIVWRLEKKIPASASGAVQEERIEEDVYGFAIRERADLDELVRLRALPAHALILIPETQVELTCERLRRDPRWKKNLERAGLEFLRLPFIEQLLRETWTERPEFQLAWGLDPPLAQGQEQMELF
ncbi:MAG TPA: DNA methyltransferase [Anaerolineae bacterium]|nr:DNA methyltransferase [Anaerolineae bacterium]